MNKRITKERGNRSPPKRKTKQCLKLHITYWHTALQSQEIKKSDPPIKGEDTKAQKDEK